MARHVFALATPATAALYRVRMGTRPVLELPFRQQVEWGGVRLTTFPAGHCLGSAMLLAEDDGQRLLYSGDFKLVESHTSETADPPKADILVIESTYGDPRYRFIPRAEAIAQLVDVVRTALAQERTPVVRAYALGKAQEVTAILTRHGIGVLQHPEIHAISQVYRACGVDLGEFRLLTGRPEPGYAVITTPFGHKRSDLPRIKDAVTIAVSGWATDAGATRRMGVDHAVPLSDHADFDELLALVERVEPRQIFCTHGTLKFVDELRNRGLSASRLEECGRSLPSDLSA
jgi:Cft2 family RNA processing exonuclease